METFDVNRDPILWKQAKARVGFRTHLRSYLIINAGLWLIYLVAGLSSPYVSFRSSFFPWPLFPMLGWGIGLASHYVAVYRSPNERNQIEKEYDKLKRQQSY
ncbi:MAG: 2TM domain-containing protein [Cytophagaceae bacterium]|nr:MAG: 2TM domain-containing protein [Cytophagaceae bacterium]